MRRVNILFFFIGIFFLSVWMLWSNGNVLAGVTDNVWGWAWSENTQWISFNCNNYYNTNDPSSRTDQCSGYKKYDYGVKADQNGLLSGYAYSDSVGYISFNSSAPSSIYRRLFRASYESSAISLASYKGNLYGTFLGNPNVDYIEGPYYSMVWENGVRRVLGAGNLGVCTSYYSKSFSQYIEFNGSLYSFVNCVGQLDKKGYLVRLNDSVSPFYWEPIYAFPYDDVNYPEGSSAIAGLAVYNNQIFATVGVYTDSLGLINGFFNNPNDNLLALGIYKSSNGTSWTKTVVPSSLSGYGARVFHEFNGSFYASGATIFEEMSGSLAFKYKILKYNDVNTWSIVYDAPIYVNISGDQKLNVISFFGSSADRIFAGGNYRVYSSISGASGSWSTSYAGGLGGIFNFKGSLYAPSGSNLLRYNGSSWSVVLTMTYDILAIGEHKDDLFVGGYNGKLYKSPSGNPGSWTELFFPDSNNCWFDNSGDVNILHEHTDGLLYVGMGTPNTLCNGVSIYDDYSWLDGCPTEPCEARIDLTDDGSVCGQKYGVCGWARVVSPTGGQISWIKLSGTDLDGEKYGVKLEEISPNKFEFKGWAYGAGEPYDTLGWMTFNCKDGGYSESGSNFYDTCGLSNYKVLLNLNQPPEAPVTQAITWNHCSFQAKSIPTFSWTYSDPNNDPMASYEIWLDDSSSFSGSKFYNVVNQTVPSGSVVSYALNLTDDDSSPDWRSSLAWNRSYYWKVRTKDNQGNWSDFSAVNSFSTPVHPYPWVDFSWLPIDPIVGEIVDFENNSKCYNSSGNQTSCSSYLWQITVGSGEFVNSSPSSFEPDIKFTVKDNKIKLTVTHDTYSCSSAERSISTRMALPDWIEVRPQ